MADNYLEKKYRDVFGEHSGVNPETGFEERRSPARRLPVRLPKGTSGNKAAGKGLPAALFKIYRWRSVSGFCRLKFFCIHLQFNRFAV